MLEENPVQLFLLPSSLLQNFSKSLNSVQGGGFQDKAYTSDFHSKLPTASLIFNSQRHLTRTSAFSYRNNFQQEAALLRRDEALFLIASRIGRLNTVEHVFPPLVTFITRSPLRPALNFISSPLMDFTKRSPDLIPKFHPLGHQ